MAYKHKDPRYVFFNVYGGRVAHIISRGNEYKEPTAMQAEENLLAIQAPRRETWVKAVKKFAATRKLSFPQEPLLK